MANWIVKTLDKKSIEEHQHFYKDGKTIVYVTGWRWGEWEVETNDDNPPEFEFTFVPGGNGKKDSIDMYNCCDNNIEQCEMNHTSDGWYTDIVWPDDMEDEERERLESAMEENGVYEVLEEQEGYYLDETEMWIWGPIEICDEDGNRVRAICADDDGNVVDFEEDE